MPSPLRSRSAFLLGLALALVLHLALRLNFIDEPLERDEGFYATVALTLLDGGVPYRDAIDIKPPGIALLYALMIKLGGEQLATIRVGSAIYSALTLLALAAVATAARGRRVGLLAAALFAVFGATPLLMANSANTEVFLGLPLLLWLAGLLGRERSLRGAALAGTGVALAMLIKPVALPFALLGLLLVILQRPPGRSRLACAAAYLAPGLLLAAAVGGWFAARGAWTEFWHWNVEVPFSYAAGGFMQGPALLGSLRLYASVLLPLAGFALLWGCYVLWRQRRSAAASEVLVAGALFCAVLAFLLPGKNFAHYYVVIIPFACLATAWLLDELLRRAASAPARPRLLAGGLLVGWLVAFGVYVNRVLPWHFGASGNDVVVNKYGSDLFVQIYAVGQLIGRLSQPGDTLFAWGFDPQIYFYSGRRPASRYIGNVLPAMDDRGTASLTVLRRELERNRPRFIVIIEGSMDVIGVREFLAYLNQHGYQHRFDRRYFEGMKSYRIGVFERP